MLIYDLMIQGPVKVNMADLFQPFNYMWMFDFLFQVSGSSFLWLFYTEFKPLSSMLFQILFQLAVLCLWDGC